MKIFNKNSKVSRICYVKKAECKDTHTLTDTHTYWGKRDTERRNPKLFKMITCRRLTWVWDFLEYNFLRSFVFEPGKYFTCPKVHLRVKNQMLKLNKSKNK